MTQIKSALGLGFRPSAHILALKNPGSKWTPADHAVAEAFQILQDETCPNCGHPVWVCRTQNNNVEFIVNTEVCQVTAALDRKEAAASKSKSAKKKPGEFNFVRIKMHGDLPKPDRDSYYQDLAEERAIHEKKKRDK